MGTFSNFAAGIMLLPFRPFSVGDFVEVGESSVNLVVRPWVRTSGYERTRWDLTRALKESLKAAGCSIPFPQRDVHLHQPSA